MSILILLVIRLEKIHMGKQDLSGLQTRKMKGP